jgi:hypothetical protein
MISADHLICATGNRTLSSSPKTRIDKNKRIVTTTPYKYEDEEIVNRFVEMCKQLHVVMVGQLRHPPLYYASLSLGYKNN